MYNFTHTLDRHSGLYQYKTANFPDSYDPEKSTLNYAYDPDGFYKL